MFLKQVITFAATTLVSCLVLVGVGITGYRAMGSGSQQAPAGGQPPGDSGRPQAIWMTLTRKPSTRRDSMNNLKQIILGIMAFEEANGFLPPPAIRDPKSGKPLLSWRVAILPWIGAQDLYQQFDLSEAWDGPHNKPLLDKMPEVYALAGGERRTIPMAPSIKSSSVPAPRSSRWKGDGSSALPAFPMVPPTTLAVVEGGQSVPWTKPEDLPFDPAGPLPKLGGLFKDGFNAAFVDASVRFVGRGTDPKEHERLLKAFITRNGGETVSAGPTASGPDRRPNPEDRAATDLAADQPKKLRRNSSRRTSRMAARSAAQCSDRSRSGCDPGVGADERQGRSRLRARLCGVVGAAHASET